LSIACLSGRRALQKTPS
jgi:hypothetical protein